MGEIIGTSALKSADGLTRPWPTLLVLLGYISASFFISVAMRTIPVGVVYALLSGVGIVVLTLVGYFYFHQKLDGAAVLGLILIMLGGIVINLFSKTNQLP